MPGPPSGGQTGVLQRHTGVFRRHTLAAPTALVSIIRNVATLLLLAVAGTLNPYEASREPQQYPHGSTLAGMTCQWERFHDRDAVRQALCGLGQHWYSNVRLWEHSPAQLLFGTQYRQMNCSCQIPPLQHESVHLARATPWKRAAQAMENTGWDGTLQRGQQQLRKLEIPANHDPYVAGAYCASCELQPIRMTGKTLADDGLLHTHTCADQPDPWRNRGASRSTKNGTAHSGLLKCEAAHSKEGHATTCHHQRCAVGKTLAHTLTDQHDVAPAMSNLWSHGLASIHKNPHTCRDQADNSTNKYCMARDHRQCCQLKALLLPFS
jgi:hypothetical protein